MVKPTSFRKTFFAKESFIKERVFSFGKNKNKEFELADALVALSVRIAPPA